MRIIGTIGGIAPGSTVEYYKLLTTSHTRRMGLGSYPAIIINSIDLTKMLASIAADDLDAAMGPPRNALLDDIIHTARPLCRSAGNT